MENPSVGTNKSQKLETEAGATISAKQWLQDTLKLQQQAQANLIEATQRLARLLESSLDIYAAGTIRQRLWELQRSLGLHGEFTSQAGQDRYFAEEIFPQVHYGVFLEIGAFDGWQGSNTFYFEKHRKWRGVVVEPCRTQASKAQACRDCQVIQAAIAGESGRAEFLEVQSGFTQMSGLAEHYDETLLRKVQNNTEHSERRYEVPKWTLNQLVERTGLGRVDLCSIDVEGAERDILGGCDWSKLDIQSFAVENNRGNAAAGVRDLLEPQGYQLRTVLGADEIYVRC